MLYRLWAHIYKQGADVFVFRYGDAEARSAVAYAWITALLRWMNHVIFLRCSGGRAAGCWCGKSIAGRESGAGYRYLYLQRLELRLLFGASTGCA